MNELSYTKPYLMTLHPQAEMDIAILTRPEVSRAVLEYGNTPSLGASLEADCFDLTGLRTPANANGDTIQFQKTTLN